MRRLLGRSLCRLGFHRWSWKFTLGYGVGVIEGFKTEGTVQVCARHCDAGRLVPWNRTLRPVEVDLGAAA